MKSVMTTSITEDICEQCGEVTDDLNDYLICTMCLLEVVDFDYDKYDD